MKFERSALYSPGTIFLVVAFLAAFLASISLPTLPALEIARTRFNTILAVDGVTIDEMRTGVWSGCAYIHGNGRKCTTAAVGYDIGVLSFFDADDDDVKVIGKSWTRGLILLPVATFFTLISLIFALMPGVFNGLVASAMSFFSSLVMLLAFIVEIILLLRQKDKFGIPGASTHAGAGFWLTFISLIFLFVSGCTVCIRHRRSKGEDIEMGSFFRRFRR
ncbi:hypothetical protein BKA62DRAFT_718611 [Auriculariales sp. MPI-PUGE-AT-0066]|nr:hypothetical protein BKA62DRAFT_718611 [Auriculariales sp. MPI-PUGE-AT-0066]